MKIAVSIPDILFRNAENVIKRLGLTRSEFYQRALSQYVQQSDDQTLTAALDKVYGDNPDAGLDPVLEGLQNASISHEHW
jgi:hypothetical protein